MKTNKKESRKRELRPLTTKEKLFVERYLETGNATQSAIYAGYGAGEGNKNSMSATGSRLLKRDVIKNEIEKRNREFTRKNIASANEVMKYFTDVMRGEEKDQFGLDAPLSERTRAAQELAKRTVDVINRESGKADAKVEIVVDWQRKKKK